MTSRCAERRLTLAALLLAAAPRPAVAGPPPAEPVRYSVALLHYNLQYCAGGLDGFEEATGLTFPDGYPTDEIAIEDQIIRESFLPVLDLLERHPDWGMDLEFQGMFVDALRERFPADLDRLRVIAESGQVDLISFHDSDQLFVAWPRRDLVESLDRVDAAFAAADLPVSRTVFTQEGQFAEGMAPLMAERGRDLLILPHNLFEYFHPEIVDPAPIYRLGEVDVVQGGRGVYAADGAVELRYTFFNDGELLATNDLNCYLGPAFVASEEAVAEYEAEVQANADQGYVVGTLAGFRDAVAASGLVDPIPLPAVPDGTWQPDDTQNVFRWMGGSGLWADTEDDGGVLTGVARARGRVLAAEVLAGQALLEAGAELGEAWKEITRAEVSDATGWNPFVTEVEYSKDHAAAAVALADRVSARALQALGKAEGTGWRVDTGSGEVSEGGLPEGDGWVLMDAVGPAHPEVVAETRSVQTAWYVSSEDPDLYRLHVDLGVPEDPIERSARVAFPLATADLAYSAALIEDAVVRVPLADLAAGNDFVVPLSLGLVALSDGVWLVEEHVSNHLAAHVSRSSGTLAFQDDTLPAGAGVSWRFQVLVTDDEAEALALARAVNGTPTVEVQATLDAEDPPPGEDGEPECCDTSCGCEGAGRTAGPPGPPTALAGAGLLSFAVRRWKDPSRKGAACSPGR